MDGQDGAAGRDRSVGAVSGNGGWTAVGGASKENEG